MSKFSPCAVKNLDHGDNAHNAEVDISEYLIHLNLEGQCFIVQAHVLFSSDVYGRITVAHVFRAFCKSNEIGVFAK